MFLEIIHLKFLCSNQVLKQLQKIRDFGTKWSIFHMIGKQFLADLSLQSCSGV